MRYSTLWNRKCLYFVSYTGTLLPSSNRTAWLLTRSLRCNTHTSVSKRVRVGDRMWEGRMACTAAVKQLVAAGDVGSPLGLSHARHVLTRR